MADTDSRSALTWSAIDHADASAWKALANALATADDTGEHYEHPEDLVEELEEPGVDPARDTWAVWDGAQMVGYAQLRVSLTPEHDGRVRCLVTGGVLPGHRRRGIGTRLMDLAEARAVELASTRHPGLPQMLRADGGRDGADVRRFLEARGYVTVRWFHEMRRRVDGDPVPATPGVSDLSPVVMTSPTDVHREGVRVSHNLAFRDHWGSSDSPPEAWSARWAARTARHDVSTVALHGDRVLAYVLVSQWLDREAYVATVGTVPDARGRGLALAALARTVRLCGESGDFDEVQLHVDADSPTGATRLYERAGFAITRTTAALERTPS